MEIKILEASQSPVYGKTIVKEYMRWGTLDEMLTSIPDWSKEIETNVLVSITLWSGSLEQAEKDLEKLRAFLDDFENKTIIQESKG